MNEEKQIEKITKEIEIIRKKIKNLFSGFLMPMDKIEIEFLLDEQETKINMLIDIVNNLIKKGESND